MLVTCPASAASGLVTGLIEERLAACGNIVRGIESIYRWQGAIERAEECLVILKTTAAESGRLVDRIPKLHPYEVPEVLVLPVAAGHAAYLEWVAGNVGNSQQRD